MATKPNYLSLTEKEFKDKIEKLYDILNNCRLYETSIEVRSGARGAGRRQANAVRTGGASAWRSAPHGRPGRPGLTFTCATGILPPGKQLRYGLGILGPLRTMQGSYRRIAGFSAPAAARRGSQRRSRPGPTRRTPPPGGVQSNTVTVPQTTDAMAR